MEILLIRLVESLLMPPGLMILMMLLGSLLIGRFFVTGKILVVGGFVLLIAASLPIVSNNLLALLEQTPPLNATKLKEQRVQAIVILGGGRYADAPEFNGQDTVSKHTLERLRYGARLQRQSRLPVLVTGGNPYARPVAEAELMRQTLEQAFNIPVKWVESASSNTWENARYSQIHLKRAGINRIALVTHAWHMPRSVSAFEQQGFDVTPAPTAYSTRARPLLLQFVPDAGALEDSRKALHELLGRLWYSVRY
ncbi:MAG: YdcF family protein [Thiohalophilus sp.]|uniref:YdcF family protein n=1 Tax=Thiohalophilus sp. TaxID=3028392 RepID=UPI0028704D8E|nr:YdcF family protein [Thiohalophilus sp.]MDR9436257.1 YdcF family protein [Thiohalophilus sp.]